MKRSGSSQPCSSSQSRTAAPGDRRALVRPGAWAPFRGGGHSTFSRLRGSSESETRGLAVRPRMEQPSPSPGRPQLLPPIPEGLAILPPALKGSTRAGLCTRPHAHAHRRGPGQARMCTHTHPNAPICTHMYEDQGKHACSHPPQRSYLHTHTYGDQGKHTHTHAHRPDSPGALGDQTGGGSSFHAGFNCPGVLLSLLVHETESGAV